MFVLEKNTGDPSVIKADWPSRIDKRISRALRRVIDPPLSAPVTNARIPFSGATQPNFTDVLSQTKGFDVIHLHWVSHFVDYRQLKNIGAGTEPIVWTLHDVNPITGGCHYPVHECERFKDQCGDCPALTTDVHTRQTLATKTMAFSMLGRPLHFVTPTEYVRTVSMSSTIGRNVETTAISNVIDTTCYRPTSTRPARERLNLPRDRFIIGFSAYKVGDVYKGVSHLYDAINLLKNKHKVTLVSMGDTPNLDDQGVHHVALGQISDDDTQRAFYNAIDVLVHPSLAETFGMVVAEAMACEKPVIVSDIGALRELVTHEKTGWLAAPRDPASIAGCIEECMGTVDQKRTEMGRLGRLEIEAKCAPEKVARLHADLYSRLLNQQESNQ